METASEASSEQDYSYEFAQMEVIMKTLGNNGMIRTMQQFLFKYRNSSLSCKLLFSPFLTFAIYFFVNYNKESVLFHVIHCNRRSVSIHIYRPNAECGPGAGEAVPGGEAHCSRGAKAHV